MAGDSLLDWMAKARETRTEADWWQEIAGLRITMTDARAMLFSGKARALVTLEDARHARFPEVPTVSEALDVKWHVAHWRGIVAPNMSFHSCSSDIRFHGSAPSIACLRTPRPQSSRSMFLRARSSRCGG